MTSTLVAVPVLGLLVMIQSAIISRLPLLQGYPDLVLLTIIAWALQERVTTGWQWALVGGLITGYVSAIPVGLPALAFLLTILVARVFQQRIWKTPILAMLITTLFGTMVYHLMTVFYLQFAGESITVIDAIRTVTLPSLLLNLGLAIPIYYFIKEFSLFFFPDKELL